jgi:archaemetzincin
LRPAVEPHKELDLAIRAAIGPIDDVDAELRPAFLDAREFSAMAPPRLGDWRLVRPELPQSIADFRAVASRVRALLRDRIAVLPLGQYPFEMIEGDAFVGIVRPADPASIAAFLEAFFCMPVDLLPNASFPDLELRPREVSRYQQYDANAVLDAIARQLPASAHGMLATVNVDLFASYEQEYTFGWARRSDRLAVMSFTRFDPSMFGRPTRDDASRSMLSRSLRVAVHEVGHLYGLAHCQAFRCVMNGVAHLGELDAVPLQVCPLCLRKLHLVTGLDPRARDFAVLESFKGLGLRDDAQWLEARATRLWRGGGRSLSNAAL